MVVVNVLEVTGSVVEFEKKEKRREGRKKKIKTTIRNDSL